MSKTLEQNPSWVAANCSASRDILHILYNPEIIPYSEEPATGSYSEPVEFSLHPLILFL
jgi:hypothetical protein